jgi:hypothetical protein
VDKKTAGKLPALRRAVLPTSMTIRMGKQSPGSSPLDKRGKRCITGPIDVAARNSAYPNSGLSCHKEQSTR